MCLQMVRVYQVHLQLTCKTSSSAGVFVPVQAIKVVKGILNKLTPEKFDRLLIQLIDAINSAEVLHSTIQLTFENAVAQPTFVALYAELCNRLSEVRGSSPGLRAGGACAPDFRRCVCDLAG